MRRLRGLAVFAIIALSPTTTQAVQTFKSSGLQAAVINSNSTGSNARGLFWLEPGQSGSDAGGAQIIANDGSLIWRNNLDSGGTNFNLQTYNGNQYITYWKGDNAPRNGAGYGSVEFLDTTYTKKYSVCVQDPSVVRYPGTPDTQPCVADYHESRTTDRGTILTTGRQLLTHNLTYLGGPEEGYLFDCPFYEVDIATNNVLFRWSPLDHLDQYDSIAASQFRLPQGNDATTPQMAWDYFHMNSVAVVPSPMGGYILSSRPLSSIFKLDNLGNIEWVIGGRTGGNFTVDRNAKFQYQHDAVPISATATTLTFSIFNNYNADRRPSQGPSSGLILVVDTVAKTVKRSKLFQAPPPTPQSQHGGSMQVLPNGGAVVSYGGTNFVQEYDSSSKLVNALTIVGGSSYRVYKYTGWVARPAALPDVASIYDSASNKTSVYMSWNGATEVAFWRINGGMAVAKNGFETLAVLPGLVSSVRSAALDRSGTRIGRSGVVMTSSSS